MYKATLRAGMELTTSRQGSSRRELAARMRFAITRRFVGRRVRDQLGGSLQRILLSSCVMTQYVARFYFGTGMLLQESIGTAVSAGLSHLNPQNSYVYGTGVVPLPGIESRVTKSGEIEIRGGHLCEPDTWKATGFVGQLVGEKTLVFGRSAACIRVKGGKPVSADRLEARLTASPYIERTVVVGHQRDFLSALVVLNTDSVSRWLREHGIVRHHASEMSRHPLVYGLIEAVVNEMNGALPSYETIRKLAILERDLSRELGELTSSMELRRGMIEARHNLIVESFYREQY
jgi:long-chain acyl-CoA synthetase